MNSSAYFSTSLALSSLLPTIAPTYAPTITTSNVPNLMPTLPPGLVDQGSLSERQHLKFHKCRDSGTKILTTTTTTTTTTIITAPIITITTTTTTITNTTTTTTITGEAYSASYLITKEHLLEQFTGYNLTWVNCEMGSFIMMNQRADPKKDWVNGSVVMSLDVLDFSVIHLR